MQVLFNDYKQLKKELKKLSGKDTNLPEQQVLEEEQQFVSTLNERIQNLNDRYSSLLYRNFISSNPILSHQCHFGVCWERNLTRPAACLLGRQGSYKGCCHLLLLLGRFLEREEIAIIRLERLEGQAKEGSTLDQKAAAYKRFVDFHGGS